MSHYIDRNEFHAEMIDCKLNDRLSERAINFFYILATAVSKRYGFSNQEDYNDAISSAIVDCNRYWRNFKEGRILKLSLLRNFKEGDKIIIRINGADLHTIVAGTTFMIGEDINKSMSNMIDSYAPRSKSSCISWDNTFGIYIDKTRRNMTIMDIKNRFDLDIVSTISIEYSDESDRLIDKCAKEVIKFEKPNNAFSYFTSIVNNGILKFNNEFYPRKNRDYKTIPISHINSDANGLFNV